MTDAASGIRSVTTRTPEASVGELDAGSGSTSDRRGARVAGAHVDATTDGRPTSPLAAATTAATAARHRRHRAATAVAAATAAGGLGTEVAELGADLVVEGVLERDVLAVAAARRPAVAAAPVAAAHGRRGRGARSPPSRRRRGRRRTRRGASPARRSDTLPFGSTSSTRTSISSPRSSDVLDPVDALAATELGDVEQAVTTREDVDERTELGDVDDLARVGLADLGGGRVEDEPDLALGLGHRTASRSSRC